VADSEVVRRGRHAGGGRWLPLRFGLGPESRPVEFHAIRSVRVKSELSGGERTVYTGEPETITVPFFGQTTVTDSVEVPFAYICPPEWEFARERLRAHGITMRRLSREVALDVESSRFTDVQWQARPYEGRHGAAYRSVPMKERRTYPVGSIVVPMDQRGANVAVHLFEPRSQDSFVAWGFFDAIFEQKEYAEPYVMEKVGREILARDSVLRGEYERKVDTDTAFAARPDARLNWLYLHSSWGDPWLNTYPVGRVVSSEGYRAVVESSR
jgi:hypothetical protein